MSSGQQFLEGTVTREDRGIGCEKGGTHENWNKEQQPTTPIVERDKNETAKTRRTS